MGKPMNEGTNSKGRETVSNRNRSFALVCAGVALAMVGAAYAAVPLYDLFCRVTGFGGTTQQADVAPDVILERTVKVRFDGTVMKDLAWDFKPVQREIETHIGQSNLVFYQAHNKTDKTLVGTATFNVSPPKAGAYFNKIECFCFTEQVLEPGQSIDMPVTFFVDPDMAEDSNLDNVHTITLSYTFFAVKDPEQLTARLENKDT
jgi:cytochrome c oxidase assembly protein subunit 11